MIKGPEGGTSDQIDLRGRQDIIHLARRGRLVGDEAMLRKIVAEDVANACVIVHDQNTGGVFQ